LKGKYTDETWVNNSYEIFKAIEGSGGRFNITGLNHLRPNSEQPLVIVSNHMSTLETVTIPCIIDPIRPITFVVKESLIDHYIFGPIMRAREPVTVKRKNPRDDLTTVLRKGEEMIEKGYSMVIFPQSTRSACFDRREFNSLGVKLASRAGVQVIPLAVKTDFWGNGNKIKEFGPIEPEKEIFMAFGEPMNARGNNRNVHKKITGFIESHLKEWGGEVKMPDKN
jgi:1-acyl-sn-glycerol-3-phosphate acyltransferase